RHTNAKILVPEWLRRDGIFIDYQRHDNDFTQTFRVKKTYPYSKQNIDIMVKSGAIFLLKLFDNFSKNSGKFEVKKEGRKIKKPYWYFPGIAKGFPEGALPIGYHLKQPPKPNHFCDANECKNLSMISGSVKLCGHAYHDDCWNKSDCICIHCHSYLSASIDELSKSYNKRLEMDNDTQNEFEPPKDDLLEEETNNIDEIPAYEELNQRLDRMLT
ncbi:10422_t:CDS:1, partial [Entrophospora sp. SA101]